MDEVCGLADDLGVGVHIHVAEGIEDPDAGGRLQSRSRDNWLLGHCVHLDRDLKGVILHNPESNLNNGVGYARPTRFPNRVALGTDGIGGDMLGAFRAAYLRMREDDVTSSPEIAWSWLETGWELFPEAREDRVVWSHDPMDPWHLAFTPGVRPLLVEVGGEVVLSEGRPTRVDPDEVRAKAAEQAARLHARL